MPGGSEPLRLWTRGDEVSIRLGAAELMNSRRGGSERALGRLGSEGLPVGARVLIGGLGLGFTLRAALATLPREAEVTVAELVPAVADWARGPLATLFAGCLDDSRVRLRIADVSKSIAEAAGRYDAILLDVDNGPAGQVRDGNDRLYAPSGLAAAHRTLTAGGRLAVWSEAPDARFAAALGRAGFDVEERRERSGTGRRGAVHVIWLARRR